jgi:hypothetical protein
MSHISAPLAGRIRDFGSHSGFTAAQLLAGLTVPASPLAGDPGGQPKMSEIADAVREIGELWQEHAGIEKQWAETRRPMRSGSRLELDRIERRIHALEEKIATLSPATPVEAELVAEFAAVCRGCSQGYEIYRPMQALARQHGIPLELIAAYRC